MEMRQKDLLKNRSKNKKRNLSDREMKPTKSSKERIRRKLIG
jgi:hypothetical protein